MPWVTKRSSGDLTYGSLVKYKNRLLIYLWDGNLIDITEYWMFGVIPREDALQGFKKDNEEYKLWVFDHNNYYDTPGTSVLKAIQILAMRDK